MLTTSPPPQPLVAEVLTIRIFSFRVYNCLALAVLHEIFGLIYLVSVEILNFLFILLNKFWGQTVKTN